MADSQKFTVPEQVGDPQEVDYGGTTAANYGPLARDLIPVRSLQQRDLPSLIAIDRAITGRDRTTYFTRKMDEVLHETDVRVSVVADIEGRAVGFIMARVNLGEFGRTQTSAEIDTVGVDPDYRGRGVGRALLSQLLANLTTLRVDKVLTEVDWTDTELIAFLSHCDFKPSSRLAFDCSLT